MLQTSSQKDLKERNQKQNDEDLCRYYCLQNDEDLWRHYCREGMSSSQCRPVVSLRNKLLADGRWKLVYAEEISIRSIRSK